MEHPWLFYVLFFIFGYVTCRTFYLVNTARKSISLLQLTQVVALFIIVRALEHFHYSKEYRLFTMKENNASEHNMNAFKLQFEDEMQYFKVKSVRQIIESHGSFFQQVVDFSDWKSAMVFLETNRRQVEDFINKD